MGEADLLEALDEKTPAWRLRVMLAAMREQGLSFDAAWYSATARMRVQPNMTADDAEELIEFKAWFEWARPLFEWAYTGVADSPPQLVDGEVFTPAESALFGRTPGERPQRHARNRTMDHQRSSSGSRETRS